jgi:hypothetical protein
MDFLRNTVAFGMLLALISPAARAGDNAPWPVVRAGGASSAHGERRTGELPNTYGTIPISYVQVSSEGFRALDSSTPFAATDPRIGSPTNSFIWGTTVNTDAVFVASLSLPSGAKLVYLELDLCDTNSTWSGDVQGTLFQCAFGGDNCTSVPFLATGFFEGCGTNLNEDISGSNITVNNYLNHYFLLAQTFVGDNSNGIGGMIVGYTLQVSPPPGSATFLDVPTSSPIFRFVEALVASGITAGCDATHYCPGNPITRGQMAVFLATALGLQWQ